MYKKGCGKRSMYHRWGPPLCSEREALWHFITIAARDAGNGTHDFDRLVPSRHAYSFLPIVCFMGSGISSSYRSAPTRQPVKAN